MHDDLCRGPVFRDGLACVGNCRIGAAVRENMQTDAKGWIVKQGLPEKIVQHWPDTSGFVVGKDTDVNQDHMNLSNLRTCMPHDLVNDMTV